MIRAELSEHADKIRHTAVANGVKITGQTPVLTLCRKLIDAGVDPAEPMTVYRGEIIALRIRSIGEAARLGVTETDGPRFQPYRPGSRLE